MRQEAFYDATGHQVVQDYFEQEVLQEVDKLGLTDEQFYHHYVNNLTYYSKCYTRWLEKRLEATRFALANREALAHRLQDERDRARKELADIKDKEFNDSLELKLSCHYHAGRKMESSDYANELFASAQENETLRNYLIRNWREAQTKHAS